MWPAKSSVPPVIISSHLGTILYENGVITEYQIDIVLQELKNIPQ